MKRTRYLQRILSSHSDPATMGKLVACLVRSNKFSEVERLLQCLPNAKEYNNNEDITRARIAVAWHKKDVGKVFKLIEEGSFSNGEDLIEIWDQAHFYENKCHTPVQRYRLRQRNVPPQSICPSGVCKKRGIPRHISQGLQTWFRDHGPYPNHAEKEMLAKKYGITLGQLKNWFANSRRRLRKEEPKSPNVEDPLEKGEPTPPNNQTETYFPSLSREESFVKQVSTTCPNNTAQHLTHEVPLSDQSPWKQENLTSIDQSGSPSSPIESLWKTDDGIPTVDQLSPPSFVWNEIEDVSPQRLNTNNVNPAPVLMWNNVLHYSGLNPVIAGAPFVGRTGPHQLPWLQNVVVFPRISAIALDINRFPVGLGVPGNFGQSNPLFGYDQGNVRSFESLNCEGEVLPNSAYYPPL